MVFVLDVETVNHLYTLKRILKGVWEFAQPVHVCFVDLKKAFDRILPRYSGSLLQVEPGSEFSPHHWQ